jgi:tRNA (guanine-N7-)-methyltransferase
VGKNKLARWTELGSYPNVIQPEIGSVFAKDHPIKGKWNREMFKNNSPVVLELGCGKGEYSVGLASRFTDKNFIGIDIKGARMWRGARTANDQKMTNVAFLRTRIEFVTSFFTAGEVDEIWVTFPDPHPGLRNSNKRLTSPWFLNGYRHFLKNRGIVHLKTDNSELYNYTKGVALHNGLEIIYATNDLYSANTPDESIPLNRTATMVNADTFSAFRSEILSIQTHYEKLFLGKGFNINYIAFRLEKDKIIEDAGRKAEN